MSFIQQEMGLLSLASLAPKNWNFFVEKTVGVNWAFENNSEAVVLGCQWDR